MQDDNFLKIILLICTRHNIKYVLILSLRGVALMYSYCLACLDHVVRYLYCAQVISYLFLLKGQMHKH